MLNDELDNFHLFKKKTIVKHKDNHYVECDIVLRLHYELGSILRLEGFMHIRHNPKFYWTEFLFANAQGDVIECCELLAELAPSINGLHNVKEYFEGDPKKSMHHDEKVYCPLVEFKIEQQSVFFLARKTTEDEEADLQGSNMEGFLTALSSPK
jgi:hypothetical protein